MLKGYGIASKNVRIGYEQAKGYDREQFTDAFARYLSAPTQNSRPSVPMLGDVANAGRDAGRNENSGTDMMPSSVPLKPAWIKGRDGGTVNHVSVVWETREWVLAMRRCFDGRA